MQAPHLTLADEVAVLLKTPNNRRHIIDSFNRFEDPILSWVRPNGQRVEVTLKELLQNPQVQDQIARILPGFSRARVNEYLSAPLVRGGTVAGAPRTLADEVASVLKNDHVRQQVMDAIDQARDVQLGWTRPDGERVEITLRELLQDPVVRDRIARILQGLSRARVDEYLRI